MARRGLRRCVACPRAIVQECGLRPACGKRAGLPDRDHTESVTDFVFRRQFAIEWGHCDPAGIVFNARFYEFFDRSTWLMFEAALGVPLQDLVKTYDIVGIPLVGAQAKFMAPAAFGDLADMESRVLNIRRSSFDVEHRMSVKGTLAAEGLETRVWAARHPDDPLRMKARAIPDDVIAKFKSL